MNVSDDLFYNHWPTSKFQDWRISIFDSVFAATQLFGMSVIAYHFDFMEWESYEPPMLTHKEIEKNDDDRLFKT